MFTGKLQNTQYITMNQKNNQFHILKNPIKKLSIKIFQSFFLSVLTISQHTQKSILGFIIIMMIIHVILARPKTQLIKIIVGLPM